MGRYLLKQRSPLGVVYFLQAGEGNPIKIGWSLEAPEQRRATAQTFNWLEVRILATSPGEMADERDLHGVFKHLHVRGEWYTAAHDLLDFIAAVERTGKLPPRDRHGQPLQRLRPGRWAATLNGWRRVFAAINLPLPQPRDVGPRP